MNHIFRLLWILTTWRWQPRLTENDEVCRTRFRVWPSDIDILMHMNNGKYLSLMDLGRVDLMLRMGFFHKVQRAGIYPVLASEAIRFKRSLKLFTPYAIVTRLAAWDERYMYLEQQFVVGEEVYASALVKARFLRKTGGKVSPQELWEIVGWKPKDRPPTPAVKSLIELEAGLRD